jgi:hypothetical protein
MLCSFGARRTAPDLLFSPEFLPSATKTRSSQVLEQRDQISGSCAQASVPRFVLFLKLSLGHRSSCLEIF